MAARPLVAGNWKMHGLRASVAELQAMIAGAAAVAGTCDLLVCPPATLIAAFAEQAKGSTLSIGAQDCHPDPAGAHTGDLAAEMLKDAGAAAVIVGHSERRADHGETDALVQSKAMAARRAGLLAIVCVGETKAERDAGRTLAIVTRQVAGSVPNGMTAVDLVIAYEPVWAIGTGLTPTPDDVTKVHAFIRGLLAKQLGGAGAAVRILYGGSVKPENAGPLLLAPECDGALVGGASLQAKDFLAIAGVYAPG